MAANSSRAAGLQLPMIGTIVPLISLELIVPLEKKLSVCSVGSNLLIGTKNVSLEQIIPLEQMKKKYPIRTSSRREKRKREEKN